MQRVNFFKFFLFYLACSCCFADLIPKSRPLFIASSGGGGHISAIEALIEHYERDSLPLYQPTLPQERQWSLARSILYLELHALNYLPVETFYTYLGWDYPYEVLPSVAQIEAEVAKIAQSQHSPRLYVDMLLDCYDIGYESAAIWNILQRQGDPAALKTLIGLQGQAEHSTKSEVQSKIFQILKKAFLEKKPYTEIVCTQPLSLDALSAAILSYHSFLKQNGYEAPLVTLEHYMTELPSPQALHFLRPLKQLTAEEKKLISLHLIVPPLSEADFYKIFEDKEESFKAVYYHSYVQNPLVRQAFKEPLDLSSPMKLNLKTPQGPCCLVLNPTEKVATTMLGSQGGQDIFRYLYPLLESYDHVFLLGVAQHQDLMENLYKVLNEQAFSKAHVYLLPHQSAETVAGLLQRSDILVIRGGGLTVMEQLAIKHPANQQIFFHYAEHLTEFESGVCWEDANIDIAKKLLEEKGLKVYRSDASVFHKKLQNSE